MLVEDADQGNVVPCLICKQSVKVPTPGGAKSPPAPPSLESTQFFLPPQGEFLTPIFDDDEPNTGPKFRMD